MKKWFGIVSLLLVMALLVPAYAQPADMPVVGILQYVQIAALDAAREGFLAGLKALAWGWKSACPSRFACFPAASGRR
jgi:ABC-type uncharacterized transport system substrate-binding protein